MKKLAALILVIAIAILPVFCACADTGADSPVNAAVQVETKPASQETSSQQDEIAAFDTVPSTEPAATSATEPAANPTTAEGAVTTTVPSAEPTTAKESAPPQTSPAQTEYNIGVDTEGAIVYESGNDVIVSWADSIMVINGAAGNIAEQFTDYFVYGGIYYINVSNDPTWSSYEYTAGDELMEITAVSDNRKLSQLSDGTSSELAVGTKIYKCENRPDMLLALVDGEYLPYYAMIEG